MGRRIIIHNHAPKPYHVSNWDAYFNTASRDPYQYVEGENAARAKQPNNPPYPDGSEARKMWVAGYRSVGA